jgi:hypothetical protein
MIGLAYLMMSGTIVGKGAVIKDDHEYRTVAELSKWPFWKMRSFIGMSLKDVYEKTKELGPEIKSNYWSYRFKSSVSGREYFVDLELNVDKQIVSDVKLDRQWFIGRVGSAPVSMPELRTFEASPVRPEYYAFELAKLFCNSDNEEIVESKCMFYMPRSFKYLSEHSWPGSVRVENASYGQTIFVIAPFSDREKVCFAAIGDYNNSMFSISSQFNPASNSSPLTVKRKPFDWKSYQVRGFIIFPNEVLNRDLPYNFQIADIKKFREEQIFDNVLPNLYTSKMCDRFTPQMWGKNK